MSGPAPRFVIQPRLVPVVRLEPTDLSPDRPLPRRDDVPGWNRRWRDCLADAGHAGLEPLVEQQHLVALDHVVEPALLRRLVAIHAAPVLDPAVPAVSVEDARDWLLSVPGGFALCDSAREADPVVLSPGCCTGLHDLEPWREAVVRGGSAWRLLWNGHPPAKARRAGERVEVAPDVDCDDPPDDAPLVSLDRAALLVAIDRAEAEVRAFAERLAPIVRAALGDRAHLADTVTAILAGLAPS